MKQFVRVLLGVNIASLLRGLQNGHRALVRASYAAYWAVAPLSKSEDRVTREQLDQIPVEQLGNILGSRQPYISLRIMEYEDGVMPRHDALALVSLLSAHQPREVLEIGTYMGHTTRAIAENLGTGIVHTVDLPPEFSAVQPSSDVLPKDDFHLISRRVVGREFKGLPCEERIVQHFGDTAVMDFSQVGQPNFFFIDGSHTYEYCKNDSEKCLALCPKDGIFLWHDCNATHPGVIRFILEWRALGRKIIRIDGTDLAYWSNTA